MTQPVDNESVRGEVTLCVWEGEWPSLKSAVGQLRRELVRGVTFVVDVFDAKGYVTLARQAASQTDEVIVDSSKIVSKTVRENPWLAPASGFVLGGSFVFAKCLRWGVYSAARISLVSTGMALCLVYPHELRHFVLEKLPF